MKPPTKSLTGMAVLLYLFLYAPLLVVVVFSFNAARHGAGWQGFTLRWYGSLLENRLALEAAKNTLLLAACSTLIATVVGTMLGYGLSRREMPGRNFLSRLLHLPVFMPDIVMAVALLLFDEERQGGKKPRVARKRVA